MSKEQRFDIHQHITNQIVAAIEAGAGEFRLPWHRSSGNIMRPVNVASKKSYRGVNVLAFGLPPTPRATSPAPGAPTSNGPTPARRLGRARRRLSSSSTRSLNSRPSPRPATTETTTRLFARATPVFAAEQVEGYVSPALPETPAATVTPIERAEAFVAATGAIIHHGGTRAFYRPSTDAIHLPPREAFVGTATSSPAEGYYSTLCHELIHFTSAEHRCNRQLGKRFGDQAYAMEELIAELGAAFLCADLGISDAPRADHAQYLTTWLSVLKADKKAIFTAASKASEAAAFLASLQGATRPHFIPMDCLGVIPT